MGIWKSSGISVSTISSISKTSSIWVSSKSSVWDSGWEDSGGSWGRSLLTVSSSIKSSLEFSLGSSYFWGIFNWCWGNTFENWCNGKGVFVDWGFKIENWGYTLRILVQREGCIRGLG